MFFYLFLLPLSLCWWDEGHMLVTQIATSRILPDRLTKIENLLQTYSTFFLYDSSLLASAVWADEIKKRDFRAFNTWHYYDEVYNPNNDTINYIPDTCNIVWALDEAYSTLNSTKSDIYGKTTMLKLLLHFVGDVHQPLHNVALFNSRFTTGDQGGNLFLIYVNNQLWNLHSFWDSAGTKYNTSFTYPLTSQSEDNIKSTAEDIMKLWPYQYFNLTSDDVKNFTKWHLESYERSITYVYLNNTLKYNDTVPPQYMEETQKICEQLIALAGYRLGNLLNTIDLDEQCNSCVPVTTTGLSEAAKFSLLFLGGLILGGVIVGGICGYKSHKSTEQQPLIT